MDINISQKRKRYLINKKFQLKLLSKIYLSILAVIFCLGVLFFVFTNNRLSYIAYDQIVPQENTGESFSPLIFSIAAGGALFTLLVIFWRYTLESHRIAGPIYHFEKVIAEINKGDLSAKVLLRKKDEFQKFAWEFNEMIDFLRSRNAGYKIDIDNLLEKVNKLSASKNTEEKIQLEQEIRSFIMKIKLDLNNIKT